MQFIATANDLEFLLDDDLRWRLREISTLKGLVEKSPEGLPKDTVLRAALPLLYAHWEGYIKLSSDRYLVYVYGRRPSAVSLKPSLAYTFLEPRFKGLGGGSGNFKPEDAILFAEEAKSVTTRPNPSVMVNTKSNLRYDVLCDIVDRLAINDFSDLISESTLNELLCDKRNHIAHGKSVPVTEESFSDLRDEFTELMRSFKNRLVTAASNKEYLR